MWPFIFNEEYNLNSELAFPVCAPLFTFWNDYLGWFTYWVLQFIVILIISFLRIAISGYSAHQLLSYVTPSSFHSGGPLHVWHPLQHSAPHRRVHHLPGLPHAAAARGLGPVHHPAQHQAAQTRRASRGRRRGGRHHGPQLERERTGHHVNICTLTPRGTDADQTQTEVCPRFAQIVLGGGAADEGTEGASLFRGAFWPSWVHGIISIVILVTPPAKRSGTDWFAY